MEAYMTREEFLAEYSEEFKYVWWSEKRRRLEKEGPETYLQWMERESGMQPKDFFEY
jgi:hypothetical protein